MTTIISRFRPAIEITVTGVPDGKKDQNKKPEKSLCKTKTALAFDYTINPDEDKWN
jgi:hypothetical protein